jgi:hypothetical protein
MNSPRGAAADGSPFRADYKSVLMTPSSSKRPSVSAPGSTQQQLLLLPGASGDFFSEAGSPRAGDMTPGRLQASEVSCSSHRCGVRQLPGARRLACLPLLPPPSLLAPAGRKRLPAPAVQEVRARAGLQGQGQPRKTAWAIPQLQGIPAGRVPNGGSMSARDYRPVAEGLMRTGSLREPLTARGALSFRAAQPQQQQQSQQQSQQQQSQQQQSQQQQSNKRWH